MGQRARGRQDDARRGQAGFTFIELLVTVAILGVLAGVVVFSIGGVSQSAAETGCLTEYRTIVAATEFAAQNGGTIDQYLDDDPRFFQDTTPAGTVPTWSSTGAHPGVGCPDFAP